MSIYVPISASLVASQELKTTIPGTVFKQGSILFSSGTSLGFANALSGISDIGVKNYTNFYLTPNTRLTQILSEETVSISPTKITTTLQQGVNNFVSIVVPPDDTFQYVTTEMELVFSQETPRYNNQFTIDILDSKYCTISYDDFISTSYIIVSNGQCKLKRAPLISSNENYFRYVINGDKLILLKDISGSTSIITSNNGKLSAVNFTQHVYNNIIANALTINAKASVNLPSVVNQEYIQYTLSGLDISSNNKVTNITGNYLLCRNHDSNNSYDVILLKNTTSEVGEVGLFNSLGLSGSDVAANYRNYTSINHNIDQSEDNSLSLNYVCYNESTVIYPGINRFTTSDTIFPYSVLNINDTTFVNNGAFGSLTPKYADKVYKEYINNIGESATYLCTWLSYDRVTDRCLWLDRYYYPNLTTKEQTLTASIYSDTFNTYIDQLINSNLGLETSVKENQYFDKISDFAFEPSTSYIYDRIDLDNVDFFVTKNEINSDPGYYTQINENNGFTLGFYINQYTGPDTITLSSQFNYINGGLKVEYSSDTVKVDVTFYSAIDGYKTYTSGVIVLPARSRNSIVCHIDNNLGIVKVYLNEDTIIDDSIVPLTYNVIVYGDFVVADAVLNDSVNYLADVFLSLSPLNTEELELLVTKYNTIYNTYSISLPCGMRNRTDIIKHINTVESASFSKSNAFDIFLNGLELTDDEKDELLRTIKTELVEVMPLNSAINNIEIL